MSKFVFEMCRGDEHLMHEVLVSLSAYSNYTRIIGVEEGFRFPSAGV